MSIKNCSICNGPCKFPLLNWLTSQPKKKVEDPQEFEKNPVSIINELTKEEKSKFLEYLNKKFGI